MDRYYSDCRIFTVLFFVRCGFLLIFMEKIERYMVERFLSVIGRSKWVKFFLRFSF